MERDTSPEQFIPDHVFTHIVKGTMLCYDGNRSQTLNSGEHYLFRKNRLVKYRPEKRENEFEIIKVCFDERFLKEFQARHKIPITKFNSPDTSVKINKSALITNFIHSLKLYYDSSGKLDEAYVLVKYEELLIILLQSQPELSGIFFDYGIPAKINIEEFMNCNYKFNVSVERFAYLTGRSLSAFKRDFQTIFNMTPKRWLVQKRLQEAYFLIDKENKKPSEIYLDIGFESLSHFSFAFRKLFGFAPTELVEQK